MVAIKGPGPVPARAGTGAGVTGSRVMSKSTRIDPGRVIMVPIFVFFLIQVACVIVIRGRNLSPVTVPKVLNLIYSVLVACFYVLMVVLYLVRTSATATTPSLVTKVIAVAATFLPFTLLVLPEPMVKRAALVACGDLIMLLGIGLSVYALGTLGRSFSIIPQARRLMRSGPYRIVRHPLYLGELITMFGAVLASATAARAAVCLLLVACQVYRAIREEQLLGGAFPEYPEYASRTARFVPGVF